MDLPHIGLPLGLPLHSTIKVMMRTPFTRLFGIRFDTLDLVTLISLSQGKVIEHGTFRLKQTSQARFGGIGCSGCLIASIGESDSVVPLKTWAMVSS